MKPLHLVASMIIWGFCAGCSHGKHEEADPLGDERMTSLEQHFSNGLEATTLLLDKETGWPSNTDCDGLLWAGKAATVGLPSNLDLAEYSPGEIHRRPAPACWNESDGDVGSKSTISNDMILGWLWAKWETKDYAALKRLADYGEAHNWIMGKPASMLARVYLKPNQQGLLGRMLYALSGRADDRSYRHLPSSYPPVSEDYERHLQALGILLQGSVTQELGTALVDIDDQMLLRLEELAAAEPENALFQTALGVYSGDFTQAITLLLNDSTPTPSYVRGGNAPALAKIEWLFAAGAVIRAHHSEESL